MNSRVARHLAADRVEDMPHGEDRKLSFDDDNMAVLKAGILHISLDVRPLHHLYSHLPLPRERESSVLRSAQVEVECR